MQSLSYQRQVLLDTVSSTAAGVSAPVFPQGREEIALYMTSLGTGTTTGGTVLLETADYDPKVDPVYAGTWSTIQSIDPNDFTGLKTKAYFISPNAYSALRVRISSAITGGGTIKAVVIMQ